MARRAGESGQRAVEVELDRPAPEADHVAGAVACVPVDAALEGSIAEIHLHAPAAGAGEHADAGMPGRGRDLVRTKRARDSAVALKVDGTAAVEPDHALRRGVDADPVGNLGAGADRDLASVDRKVVVGRPGRVHQPQLRPVAEVEPGGQSGQLHCPDGLLEVTALEGGARGDVHLQIVEDDGAAKGAAVGEWSSRHQPAGADGQGVATSKDSRLDEARPNEAELPGRRVGRERWSVQRRSVERAEDGCVDRSRYSSRRPA